MNRQGDRIKLCDRSPNQESLKNYCSSNQSSTIKSYVIPDLVIEKLYQLLKIITKNYFQQQFI
ncbi:hypothetical protein CWATWH0402_4203 [Crocosphaera watsonii WH 0402]|uniref:Uncharacterized protein n=2 Tax=Crocosphaera watsonii TaxID=263511 RepID=T2JKP7_CROWT|nr:hypothetical protein CWATWH0005_694 [Crocosphaera watsonii WH 0005]CCQ65825.1 hypothetical protein CWATWH0402_4203 [Crocosphaera watsonii WH 0402]